VTKIKSVSAISVSQAEKKTGFSYKSDPSISRNAKRGIRVTGFMNGKSPMMRWNLQDIEGEFRKFGVNFVFRRKFLKSFLLPGLAIRRGNQHDTTSEPSPYEPSHCLN